MAQSAKDFCDYLIDPNGGRFDRNHVKLLLDAGASRQHDRYSPGLHHLAWRADGREDVDRLHALLVERGAEVLDAPAEYPQYNGGRGYYAVFFADADGLKLEYVFTPPG